MSELSKGYRKLAFAFQDEAGCLFDEFLEIAENVGYGDRIGWLDHIGDWQRIKFLDRTTMPYGLLSAEESEALIADHKRTLPSCDGEEVLLSEARRRQIDEWNNASARDRFIGLGIHALLRLIHGACDPNERVIMFRLAVEALGVMDYPSEAASEQASRVALARFSANARHDAPGGSREKRRLAQMAWLSGKYTSKDICAEQECAALNMSFSTARRALRGLPDPSLAAASSG